MNLSDMSKYFLLMGVAVLGYIIKAIYPETILGVVLFLISNIFILFLLVSFSIAVYALKVSTEYRKKTRDNTSNRKINKQRTLFTFNLLLLGTLSVIAIYNLWVFSSIITVVTALQLLHTKILVENIYTDKFEEHYG